MERVCIIFISLVIVREGVKGNCFVYAKGV